MAIRIDLLPGYVGLKRWFKRIAAVCAALVVSFAAILYLLYYNEQLKLQTLETNRDNIKKYADMADAANAAATKAENDAKPMDDAVGFLVAAGRTGAERAALLDLVRRYIYVNAVVGSIDLSDGQTAKMTVLVKNPDEYARFLLNLRRGAVPTGVLFSDPATGSGINGWPSVSGGSGSSGGAAAGPTPGGAPGAVPGAAGGESTTTGKDNDLNTLMQKIYNNKIDVSAKLREPIVVPVPPGEAAAPAGGGPGGPGGPGEPPGAPPAA